MASNRRLRAAREAAPSPRVPGAGMSRQELAEAVNAWCAEHTNTLGALDAHYVGRLEQGRVRRPHRDYRAGFCAVLGVTETELGFTSAPRISPPSRVLLDEARLPAEWIDTESAEVKSQIASGATASPTLFPMINAGSRISSAASVAGIQAMSLAFQIADRQVGGRVLYPQVYRYLSTEIGPRLLAATDGVADPFAAASSFSELAGWMAHDGGRNVTARNHLNAAYRLASVAEQDALIGNVCASMSHLASELTQPIDAVRMAEVGLTRVASAKGVTALRARLHAMRARGLAISGENRASVAALAQAERVLGAAIDEEPANWIARFDAASLASESALCLRQLGDLSEAQRYAERVIQLRSGDRVRSRAFGQLMLAEVVAEAGRPDEAAAIGLAVGGTLGTLSSERVRSRLVSLGRLLRPYVKVPQVSSFLELVAVDETAGIEGDLWPI